MSNISKYFPDYVKFLLEILLNEFHSSQFSWMINQASYWFSANRKKILSNSKTKDAIAVKSGSWHHLPKKKQRQINNWPKQSPKSVNRQIANAEYYKTQKYLINIKYLQWVRVQLDRNFANVELELLTTQLDFVCGFCLMWLGCIRKVALIGRFNVLNLESVEAEMNQCLAVH